MKPTKDDLILLRHIAQNHLDLLENKNLNDEEKESLVKLFSFIGDHELEYLLYGYEEAI